MKESVHLGKIRGIRVGIHWSLLVIAGLVVAGLADSQLPALCPGHTSALYRIAALVTAAVFYGCFLAPRVGSTHWSLDAATSRLKA